MGRDGAGRVGRGAPAGGDVVLLDGCGGRHDVRGAAGRGHAGGGLEAHERCDDRHSYRKDGAYAGACGCLSRVWGDETRARGSSGTPRGSCPCRRCRCGRDDACDCVVARSEAESLCVDHVSNRSVAHIFNGKRGGLCLKNTSQHCGHGDPEGFNAALKLPTCRPAPHSTSVESSKYRPQTWIRTGTKVRLTHTRVTIRPPDRESARIDFSRAPASSPSAARGEVSVSCHEGRAFGSTAASVPHRHRSLTARGSDLSAHLSSHSQSYSPRRGPAAA